MLKIICVKKPRWGSADRHALDVDVMFEEYEELGLQPFSTQASADTEHGLEIWEKAMSGEYGPIADYVASEPKPVVVVIPAVTLWERLTETEAEQVADVMATQPFRTRQIFNSALTYRSDHELWPLLEQMATELFGNARAAELLAP
ncbi:hypothetical protein [Ochrobactrum sp. S1502_03]|uniref:hypothetical protein n=1 Tax=Ochrobactrum sp. S1502_03 TaxID=3108451 RepID=UPI0037C57D97